MENVKYWLILLALIGCALAIGLTIGSFIPTEKYIDGHKYKMVGIYSWSHDPECGCK